MSTAKIHLPRPTTGGFLTDPLPLWCGKAREFDTHTTSFPHRATCERCIAAQQRYVEESDYQLARAKRAAESEHEAGVADRVHFSRDTTPGLTGRARALCGQWSQTVTADRERVTCLACLRHLSRPQPKAARRGGAIHYLTTGEPDTDGMVQGRCQVRTSRFSTDPAEVSCLRCLTVTRRNALVVVLSLAACGPSLPDEPSIDTSTGVEIITSGDELEDTGSLSASTSSTTTGETTSTGSSSTSDTTGVATTGVAESSTSETSSGGECVELPCETGTCHAAEQCRPHPDTGVPTCVQSCASAGVPCMALVCEAFVPGVCIADPLGFQFCYPV